jgi:predicted DNA-binding antitoxin AbrB/MazE fold protein
MTTLTCEAVYENGVLRPTKPLGTLAEGATFHLTVATTDSHRAERKTYEELLQQMREEGRLVSCPRPSEPIPADWRPVAIQGEPLSETVLKMRD